MNDYVVEGLICLAFVYGYEVIIHNGKAEVPELEKENALCSGGSEGRKSKKISLD